MKKLRVIALAIVLMLLSSLSLAQTYIYDGLAYTTTDTEAAIESYFGAEETVVIPRFLDIDKPVTRIRQGAFIFCAAKTVYVPVTVRTIEQFAFDDGINVIFYDGMDAESTPTPEATTEPETTPEATEEPAPSATPEETIEPSATATATPKPTATASPTPKPTATASPTPKPTDSGSSGSGSTSTGSTSYTVDNTSDSDIESEKGVDEELDVDIGEGGTVNDVSTSRLPANADRALKYSKYAELVLRALTMMP